MQTPCSDRILLIKIKGKDNDHILDSIDLLIEPTHLTRTITRKVTDPVSATEDTIIKTVRSFKPTIIHVLGLDQVTLSIIDRLGSDNRSHVVVSTGGLINLVSTLRRSNSVRHIKHLLNNVDLIHVHTEGERDVLSSIGITTEVLTKYFLSHLSTLPDLRIEDRGYILYKGSLERRSGIREVMIGWINYLRHNEHSDDAHLYIVGEESEYFHNKLYQLTMPLSNRMVYLGTRDGSTYHHLLANSSAVINLDKGESVPHLFLEAWYYKKIAIMSNKSLLSHMDRSNCVVNPRRTSTIFARYFNISAKCRHRLGEKNRNYLMANYLTKNVHSMIYKHLRR